MIIKPTNLHPSVLSPNQTINQNQSTTSISTNITSTSSQPDPHPQPPQPNTNRSIITKPTNPNPSHLPHTSQTLTLNSPIQFGSFQPNPEATNNIAISISGKALQQSRKFWENSLILHAGALKIDNNILRDKLAWTWKIKGHLHVSPMGHGFTLLKFDLSEDRWRALLHGPCILFGFLLSIRPWESKFKVPLFREGKPLTMSSLLKKFLLPSKEKRRESLVG